MTPLYSKNECSFSNPWCAIKNENEHSFLEHRFEGRDLMSDTTTESLSGADRPQTPILRTLAIATGLTAIIAVIVLAFSWPAVTADPDDVTLAVVGPEAAVSAIETQLTKEGDGVFDITAVDDREEAIGGITIATLIVGSVRRILAVTVYSAVGSVVLTSILQGWFGSIQGDFWLNVGAFSITIAAIATPMIGFVALIGRIGTAVGPVVMMLFANPISGAALPPQFLPGSWGEIGQWFPPGAAATLVRELSYFPNADMTLPWLVLTGWVVGGLILTLVGHFRTTITENRADSTSEKTSSREATVTA